MKRSGIDRRLHLQKGIRQTVDRLVYNSQDSTIAKRWMLNIN